LQLCAFLLRVYNVVIAFFFDSNLYVQFLHQPTRTAAVVLRMYIYIYICKFDGMYESELAQCSAWGQLLKAHGRDGEPFLTQVEVHTEVGC
jgi:hypothetical protein